jgi:hypothetical protein
MLTYLNYKFINIDLFPADYSDARQRILTSARLTRPLHHLKLESPGRSPNGDVLITDSFWYGSENAEKVIVLLSGTHGVEGFVGTAIQLDHLDLIAANYLTLSPNTALLIVHALTPWGYAWCRRCDHDGIDLNRNYVDFKKSLPVNEGYAQLTRQLSNNIEKWQEVFLAFEHAHGREAFEIALSGGQYIDPDGPFYGGTAPAHGRKATETLIERYALAQRTLAVIDLHSGLGPFGYGEIICDHPIDSKGIAIAKSWYGDSVTLPVTGTSSSVPKLGLMDYAWHHIMNKHSCHITLEFGTYRTHQLFAILLRDHWLWQQDNNATQRYKHANLMRQHFCPNDDAWKAMVLFRARQVIAQALTGLAHG